MKISAGVATKIITQMGYDVNRRSVGFRDLKVTTEITARLLALSDADNIAFDLEESWSGSGNIC
jgi:hypothetical protein